MQKFENQLEAGIEAVLEPANLEAAYKAVKANDGAPGVDGLSVEDLRGHWQRHGEMLLNKLRAGTYVPAAVRAVEIPKASGGVRVLGIPTVLDRMIQQGIHQVLSPVFEPSFSQHSYGFRPGRSAHQAVRTAQGYVKEGKNWVADIDLKSFFDQVDHDKLMAMLGRRVRDKALLRLIGGYLRAPLRRMNQDRSTQEPRRRGTPQGGPLSPLLANIYLDPLDKELERRGIAFVRYADDIALFCASREEAQELLENIIQWLRRHLKLEVNQAKSGVGPSGESGLLGFRIHEDGRIGVAPKAIAHCKERVRQLWDARPPRTWRQMREDWRQFIRGWWNYFQLAERRWELYDLNGWIRRHMRKCIWQRWHNWKGRLNWLRKLGVPEDDLGLAFTSEGAWPTSKRSVLSRCLGNQRLKDWGLIIPWGEKPRSARTKAQATTTQTYCAVPRLSA